MMEYRKVDVIRTNDEHDEQPPHVPDDRRPARPCSYKPGSQQCRSESRLYQKRQNDIQHNLRNRLAHAYLDEAWS